MKKKVAVIFGGRSVEHEVSVISGLQVLENIDESKYTAVPLYINKEGKWFTGDSLRKFKNYKENNLNDLKEIVVVPTNNDYNLYTQPESVGLFGKKIIESVDVAFPVIHGTNGEDGTIQGVFELMNIPYVGGGVLSSSVGMDKVLMKDVFKANNLPVVNYVWFYRSMWEENRNEIINNIKNKLEFPLFVKPANLGSSVGISKAKDEDSLISAIEIAVRYDRKIIIEKAVEEPREINCAVMGYEDNVDVSLCEEPLGWKELLSYEDKYIKSNIKNNKTEKRRIPADLEDVIRAEIEKIAKNAFQVIDGRGNARIDFLLDKNQKIYINEINTMPGSIAYYLWEGKGYSFKTLIDKMIDIAFKAHDDKNKNMYSYNEDLFNKIQFGGKA
ncbi:MULTISPECIES: D-alanine--D-alanine ligase family protein [Tissierellales]|jgi:D-alanine-D-alanine ligase|uniref:D-alanine--D-alanine ligase n=1 Tax=Acidilutibacter cellobiosedens TaxID=2507161 RepID=A0A410QEK9_9FIRM|nr:MULTISPECIES: D-alanine--D-alanine ligase family protein [Tissierellales]QAT62405.1 D-alanine--D-alanine ligase [Acidilutibacter cellobiosedens]SCL89229.1 D-alanine-D-alanine ligase [Sporanaerobacter sp. PP17-6a]